MTHMLSCWSFSHPNLHIFIHESKKEIRKKTNGSGPECSGDVATARFTLAQHSDTAGYTWRHGHQRLVTASILSTVNLSTVNTKCKVLVSDLSQSDGNNTIYGVRGCCQGRLLPASHICRVEHTLTIMFDVSNANLGLEIESTPMKWCPGRTRSMHEADIAVASSQHPVFVFTACETNNRPNGRIK